MLCTFHQNNPATAQCNSCARPLCPACDHRVRGFPLCQDCIVAGVEMLQKSRAQLAAQPALRQRSSPPVALGLSLLIPGLGAAYNGQTSKALIHFAIFASFFQVAVLTDFGEVFFALGVLAAWLFAAIDAYRTAQIIKDGFAPDAELDAIGRRFAGNPLAWSLLLITLGTIFLLHTFFNITLPMRPILATAIVLLGVYTFFDYLRARRRRTASKAALPVNAFETNRWSAR